MNVPHLTPSEFRELGHRVVDWVARYMEEVEGLPVLSGVEPGQILAMLPEEPPEEGLGAPALRGDGSDGAQPGADGWDAVFADMDRIILPGLTHWQSPNFFAYFPANASGPAILGEILAAGLGVQGMLWQTSPACTELETRVLDWLARMIGLPDVFLSTGDGGGVIQGTASEGALAAIVAARRRVMRAIAGPDALGRGRLVAYASTQAHSSIIKAAMVAGVATGPDDREHVRLIEVDENLAMRPETLETAMREDLGAGRIPFFVCATVGTTSSAAIDPVRRIGEVVREAAQWQRGGVVEGREGVGGGAPHPALSPSERGGGGARPWVHVDAAYAGAACVCPEFRWMLDGVELADSICFNPHKWLLTNFDCDAFWVRNRAELIDAMSITPEYLRNAPSESGRVFDYRDWHVPLGRRFRALKLWLVVRHYGASGLRAHIREHVRLGELLEEWIRADERFELAAPRVLSLVCFRVRGPDALSRSVLDRVNATGRAFLTHTMLPGPGGAGRDRFALRMAIGGSQTAEGHVRAAWDLIRDAAAGVLGDAGGGAR